MFHFFLRLLSAFGGPLFTLPNPGESYSHFTQPPFSLSPRFHCSHPQLLTNGRCQISHPFLFTFPPEKSFNFPTVFRRSLKIWGMVYLHTAFWLFCGLFHLKWKMNNFDLMVSHLISQAIESKFFYDWSPQKYRLRDVARLDLSSCCKLILG